MLGKTQRTQNCYIRYERDKSCLFVHSMKYVSTKKKNYTTIILAPKSMELTAAKTQRRINKSDKEKMVFNEGNIRSSSCIFFYFFYMKLMNQNGFDGRVGGVKG